MPRTAFKCTVDFKMQAITCPGVWLPNKDDLYVSVCLLGQHRRTPLVSSVFPLLFFTEMNFSKVFWIAVDPTDVVERMDREHIYIEIVQLDLPASGTVLAKYEGNLRDFLFPYPAVAPKILRDRDVLLEKTIDFPNGISPRLEFSCTTDIRETPTPYTDAYESATTGLDDIKIRVPSTRYRSYSAGRSSALIPHRCDHDHIGSSHRPTHEFVDEYGDEDQKRPFVIRKIDKRLIDRVPGASAPEPFPTSVNVEYKPRSISSGVSRSRSRSRTRSSSSLRARSSSPAGSQLTRGLYGVYETGRATTPEPRRSYLDDNDDIVADYRPASPSYYEKLKKQLNEESFNRRVEQRVQEVLTKSKYPYYSSYYSSYYSPYYSYPYYSPYSSRYRYPYSVYSSTDRVDKLALDLERTRLRRSFYP